MRPRQGGAVSCSRSTTRAVSDELSLSSPTTLCAPKGGSSLARDRPFRHAVTEIRVAARPGLRRRPTDVNEGSGTKLGLQPIIHPIPTVPQMEWLLAVRQHDSPFLRRWIGAERFERCPVAG